MAEKKRKKELKSWEIRPPITSPGDWLEMMARGNSSSPEMGGVLDPVLDEHDPQQREETRRKPIVSINGRDVEDRELDRGAA
jgi:hypothetical protein